jgi:hypothetical protein
MKKQSFGMWHRVAVVLTDVSEERRLTPLLHGATSQKTAFFIGMKLIRDTFHVIEVLSESVTRLTTYKVEVYLYA